MPRCSDGIEAVGRAPVRFVAANRSSGSLSESRCTLPAIRVVGESGEWSFGRDGENGLGMGLPSESVKVGEVVVVTGELSEAGSR
jgi:hypothetical protein